MFKIAVDPHFEMNGVRKMKKNVVTLLSFFCALVFLLSACTSPGGGATAAETIEIVDMVGRTVTLPAPTAASKAGSISPVAAYMIYTVNPDKLLGWNYELNELERSHILEDYHSLPVYGMGDGLNKEAMIEAAPFFNLYISDFLDESSIIDADRLQEDMDIPVIVISGALADSAEAYRVLGKAMGEEQKAEDLAQYAEKTLAAIEAVEIPGGQRVSVYYGNGPLSLETTPQGAPSSQVIDMVGGSNVAKPDIGSGNRIEISLEQVLSWDPGVILVNGEPREGVSGNSAAEQILSHPDWAEGSAVKNGRVYGSPKAPFSWIDRPTGPNRLIGLKWLASLLYPDYYDIDIDEEVKTFYKLFYHEDLTDEQLGGLYLD